MEQFQVDKTDPSRYRVVTTGDMNSKAQTTDKSLVLEVERFAFTANNFTYYMVGEKLGYWQFFPPIVPESLEKVSDNNWGVIPVWGVARVLSSTNDAVPVGSRFFGYFPPATRLVMSNTTLNNNTLVDCSPHRLKLPQGYNIYRPLPAQAEGVNNEISAKQHMQENLQMLLWPLFATSFCLWEVVNGIPSSKREQLLVLSGSSKTSLGLAFALKNADVKAIGVTSEKRVEALTSLDIYHSVISYEQLESLQCIPTVAVDMSGNAKVKALISEKLKTHLTRYVNVGLTHWQYVESEAENDDADSDFFFAPAHIQQRMNEIGAAEYQKQSSEFVFKAITWSSSWLEVNERSGLKALEDDFNDHQQARIPVKEGRIYTLK